MPALSSKRALFCQEYIVDRNATQAAIRAGYSEAGAQQQGSRMLLDVVVKARVAELQAEAAKRNEVTVDGVVRRLEVLGARAEAAGQFGPAVRAEELRGKTLGVFVDTKRDETPKMSDEAMVEVIRRLAGDAAAAKAAKMLSDSDPSMKTVH